MTIYSENAVPVLFRGPNQRIGLSEEGFAAISRAHEAYLKAADNGDDLSKHLLTAEAVVLDNPDTDDNGVDYTVVSIGGSDLQEALTEVIGAFDLSHIGNPGESSDHIHTPTWVASTHKELAKHLADYYSCEVREISEVA